MTALEWAGIGLAVAAVLLAATLAVRKWLALRGPRVITCPANRKPARVEVDVRQALLTGALGRPHLRLHDCSRWPEMAGCGQMCLAEIEASPVGCLVRHLLEDWYVGQTCVFCGHAFDVIHWHDHRPALRTPDGGLVEWREVRAEDVPAVLATHRPVCWDCLVTETFRRRFPDRVVERPPRPASRPH